MKQKTQPNILILGAGFAGLAASKALDGFGKVTVIDPSPYFEFFPNIHELVSGFKQPKDLRLNTRKVLEARNQAFIQEKAEKLDRENKTVTTHSGQQLHYDCLIIAIGGVNHDRGVTGVKKHAIPFKSVDQCHAIGQRLKALHKQNAPYAVTIVGGGVEGIESLGEVLRQYGGSKNLSIRLIEAQDQLLPGMAPQVHREILKICEDFPVTFHFGKKVKQIEENQLILADGTNLPSDLTIWTGGVKSHPQLEAWGLAAPEAWPQVNRFLQWENDPSLFILGDAIDATGGGEKQAYLAQEMGQIAGQNARAVLKGEQLQPYQPKILPSIYAFGNLSCFVVYENLVVSGLPFASIKEAIYQYNMASTQGICDQPNTIPDTLARALKGSFRAWNTLLGSPLSLFGKFKFGFSV